MDRWLSWQHNLSQGRGRWLGLAAAVLTLAAVHLAVRATGGTPNPLVHLAYFGIIAAAVSYGWVGGIVTGTAAGLLLGPLVPDSTAASATILGTWGWLLRLTVYAVAGVLIGAFVNWARWYGAIEVRGRRMRELIDRAQTVASGREAVGRLLRDLTQEWGLVGAALFGVTEEEAYLLAATSPDHAALGRPERLEGDAHRMLREDAAGRPRRRAFSVRLLNQAAGTHLRDLGVRSELVVPLLADDGRPAGVLDASERGAPTRLEADELHALTIFCRGAAALVQRVQGDESAAFRRIRLEVGAVLREPDRLQPVYQPIASIADGRIVGYEALARFAGRDALPNVWFDEAERAGLGAELQALALRRAREVAADIAPPAGQFLTINLSPSLLDHPAVLAALDGDLRTIVIELSESEQVIDYAELRRLLEPYRRRGARVAVDDAGAGYASLRHVTELRPDFVKLDARLITRLRDDTACQALVRSIGAFTREIGSALIAEGVETLHDLESLRALDADLLVQGYAIARPAPPWVELEPAALKLVGGIRPQEPASGKQKHLRPEPGYGT